MREENSEKKIHGPLPMITNNLGINSFMKSANQNSKNGLVSLTTVLREKSKEAKSLFLQSEFVS